MTWRDANIPYVLGHVIASVTGVAGHTGATHVSAPVLVGVLRHGNHDPRHLLGVERVRLKALACDVAVVAALLGRHPLCDGSHEAREFTDRQMTKHLYVLIDVTRLGAVRAYCGDSLGHLIGRNEVCQHLGAINRLHAGAAIAPLYGLLGWYVAATEERCAQHRGAGEPFHIDDFHCAPSIIGSSTGVASSGG